MPLKALVIGSAVGPEEQLTETLVQFGIERLKHAADLNTALDLMTLGHIDVVFVAVDELGEAALAQLDRAVRMSRNTEVIGTAPGTDPEVMLKTMRAGIQEFLVRPLTPTDLAGALARVSQRHTTTLSGQIIACYGAKGGVGVSSVAANLAFGLADAKKRRVAIADFVVPNGEQRLQFNVNPAYGLRDVATRSERVDQELLNSVLAPVKGGLWLLASSDDPDVDELLDANVTNAILQQLRSGFHATVVDCDRQLNDRTLTVLDAAERILLVTQLNVSALRATQRSLSIFRRLGYPEEKLSVVVNRFQSGELISVADATDVLKAKVFFKLPNDYKVMAEAASRGVPAAEIDASSRIAAAFGELARAVRGDTLRHDAEKNGKGESRFKGFFSRKKGSNVAT